MTYNSTFNFSAQQLATASVYANSSNYPAMYRYLADQVVAGGARQS
jgi:hypothetical protein